MASHVESFPVGLSGFGNSVWVASVAPRRETFDGVETSPIGEFMFGGEGMPVQLDAKNVTRWCRAVRALNGVCVGIQSPWLWKVYLSELFAGLRPFNRGCSHSERHVHW